MKLNLRLGMWPRTRPVVAEWHQKVDVALVDGRSQGLELFGQLSVTLGARQSGVAWMSGGAAGRASFTCAYGANRFRATRRSRQLLGWLRRHEDVLSVSAGVLGHER